MFGSEFGAGLAPMLVVVGRALLGCLFVAGGLRHVTIFDAIAKDMAKRGVPLPRLALAAGTAFQIVAGTFLILESSSCRPRWGSLSSPLPPP